MKRKYLEPKVEIIIFCTQDTITTSSDPEWETGSEDGDDSFGGDEF